MSAESPRLRFQKRSAAGTWRAAASGEERLGWRVYEISTSVPSSRPRFLMGDGGICWLEVAVSATTD